MINCRHLCQIDTYYNDALDEKTFPIYSTYGVTHVARQPYIFLTTGRQIRTVIAIISVPLAIPFGSQPLNPTFDDSPVLHDQQLVLIDPVQTRYVLQGILFQEQKVSKSAFYQLAQLSFHAQLFGTIDGSLS